jgi:phage-related minor tail protein
MEKNEMIVQEVKQQGVAIEARVSNLIVNSQEKNQVAAGILGDITKAKKNAVNLRLSLTRPLDESKKGIMDLFRPHIERLERASEILESKMSGFYKQEQERVRIEEEKRLEAERKATEEIEKARRAEQEENKRKEAELKAEQDRLIAEGKAAEAEKAREEAAIKAEQARIRAIEEEERIKREVPERVIQPSATTRSVNGHVITIKEHWVHEIVNPELVPDKFWIIDDSLIRKEISSGIREIPGLRIYDEGSISKRTK